MSIRNHIYTSLIQLHNSFCTAVCRPCVHLVVPIIHLCQELLQSGPFSVLSKRTFHSTCGLHPLTRYRFLTNAFSSSEKPFRRLVIEVIKFARISSGNVYKIVKYTGNASVNFVNEVVKFR